MTSSVRSTAPPDAVEQHISLKGDELLSFLRTIPWNAFLKTHLESLAKENLLNFSHHLLDAVDQYFSDALGVVDFGTYLEELVNVFRSIYKMRTAKTVQARK